MTAKKRATKPTVFFSHSSRDASSLTRLKEAFLSKTGGSIDVFLSSDGQSIPLGANWVHRVEQGLDDSNLMFVFVSPASLRSHWLFFEAGYAYSRELRVIPIGINGVDLTALPPPLSLLQGRNLTSADGLNNLIAEVNRAFAFTHAETFTSEDFGSIFGKMPASGLPGEDAGLIETVGFLTPDMNRVVTSALDDRNQALKLYKEATAILKAHGIEHALQTFATDGIFGLEAYGASVRMMRDERAMIVLIDPLATKAGFEICEKLASEISQIKTVQNCDVAYDFRRGVRHLSGSEKISARMDRDRFKLRGTNRYVYKSVDFTIGYPNRHDPITQVNFTIGGDRIDEQSMNEVIAYLFERDILQYRPSAPPKLVTDAADQHD